jgi:hypothetical protein
MTTARTLNTTSVNRLAPATMGSPIGPTNLRAIPKSTARKMTWRMSPSTNAPKKLSGTRCVRNSHHSRVSPVWMYCWALSVVSMVAGSTCKPSPSRKTLIATRPVIMAMIVPIWK